MNPTASITACNIKAWMALRKVSNTVVANRAGVSRVMVSYVINGKRVSAPVYNTIARLCRVRLADLLAGPESVEQNTRRAA
jgi:transcriptional regulator with XRE-family HTH domain